MKAVVTGGNGFLGRRLIRQLLQADMQVTVLVRETSDIEPLKAFVGEKLWQQVQLRRVNLMDVGPCEQALAGADIVYHLAASLSGSTSTLVLESVIPTRHFIDAAINAAVKRFVLVGSFGVYAAADLKPGSILDEDTPMDSKPHLRDPYTYSKVIQERAALQAHKERGLPLVIVRPGVIFGPGRGALSSRVGLPLGPVTLRMGGGQTVPYTYVDNCAAAILLAGTVPGIEGEIFNVVDDDLPTGKQILKMYKQAGQRQKWIWLPAALLQPVSGLYEWYARYSKGQMPKVISRYKSASLWNRLSFPNVKAKQRLSWQPEIDLAEAFARSIAPEEPASNSADMSANVERLDLTGEPQH